LRRSRSPTFPPILTKTTTFLVFYFPKEDLKPAVGAVDWWKSGKTRTDSVSCAQLLAVEKRLKLWKDVQAAPGFPQDPHFMHRELTAYARRKRVGCGFLLARKRLKSKALRGGVVAAEGASVGRQPQIGESQMVWIVIRMKHCRDGVEIKSADDGFTFYVDYPFGKRWSS